MTAKINWHSKAFWHSSATAFDGWAKEFRYICGT